MSSPSDSIFHPSFAPLTTYHAKLKHRLSTLYAENRRLRALHPSIPPDIHHGPYSSIRNRTPPSLDSLLPPPSPPSSPSSGDDYSGFKSRGDGNGSSLDDDGWNCWAKRNRMRLITALELDVESLEREIGEMEWRNGELERGLLVAGRREKTERDRVSLERRGVGKEEKVSRGEEVAREEMAMDAQMGDGSLESVVEREKLMELIREKVGRLGDLVEEKGREGGAGGGLIDRKMDEEEEKREEGDLEEAERAAFGD
ncbi:MAG: hypothetical protein Q9219_000720 [cf. Caloplaca sp. 3 TL-2023]